MPSNVSSAENSFKVHRGDCLMIHGSHFKGPFSSSCPRHQLNVLFYPRLPRSFSVSICLCLKLQSQIRHWNPERSARIRATRSCSSDTLLLLMVPTGSVQLLLWHTWEKSWSGGSDQIHVSVIRSQRNDKFLRPRVGLTVIGPWTAGSGSDYHV